MARAESPRHGVSRRLKNGVAEWLVETLAPAREAWASAEKQALIAELDGLITR